MALKLTIYLPNETSNDFDFLEDFVSNIGDLISKTHGNNLLTNDFKLEDLKSFIIIKDEELPDPKNFENEDMYLVIPMEEE